MSDLKGRNALVTGASRGIGRAAALALAKRGAHVIAHYGQSAGEAESLVAEIEKAGGKALAVGEDLGESTGPHSLAKKVAGIVGKRLDILVANAGIASAGPIETQTVEEFDKLFAINVRAPYFLVQQLLTLFAEGSSIILLSSLAARAVVGDLSAYSTTKGAIHTLVKQLALPLGAKGIRVNAVAPGVIDTDISSFVRSDEGRSAVLGFQALQRVGKPDDVGDVIAFLASDESRWVTGDSIEVGGGSKL